MSLDVPKFDAPEPSPQRGRMPIDYRSRNAKLRLFVAVGGVILVLALAERARDPASWNWLFGIKGQAEQVEQPINNRVARAEAPSEEPETVFLNSEKAKLPSGNPAEAEGPARDSWMGAWKGVWRDLGTDERTLLFRLVEAAGDDKQFSSESSGRAEAALGSINDLWTTYQSAAYQEFSALSGEEQALWLATLKQVNARWLAELRPALQLVALGGNPSGAERKTIANFQRDLVQLCLTQVRDDATFLRPDENQIWFHLMHELQTHSPAELADRSEGTVGYNAMYNQPEAYRGKVITVRAQVRRAYRVPAIKNYLGIKEFNVLWLAPEGVPDKPLIVYSLGLPPGFPRLDEQNHPSGMTILHEDVVVSGYFFKRGAYRGKDANYTAPLILAKSLEWTPEAGRQVTFAEGQSIWREALLVSTVAFAVAAAVAYYVSRRGAKSASRFDREQNRAEIAELHTAELPPTLRESLQKLSEEARHDAN